MVWLHDVAYGLALVTVLLVSLLAVQDSPTSPYASASHGGFEFSIEVTPKDNEVSAGGTATFNINVERISGSFPVIYLSLKDMDGSDLGDVPISYSFNPPSGTPSFSSTLSIQTSSSAGGAYGFRIDFQEEGHASPFTSEYITLSIVSSPVEEPSVPAGGGPIKPITGYISIGANEFNLPSYKQTTPVKIFGNIDGYLRGTPITIEILNPDGSVENFSIIGSKDGDYELQYYLTETSQAGVYTAVVKYQNFWASISFSVFEKEEKKTTPTPVMPPQILFDKESYSATDVGALIVISISDDFDPNTIESVKAKLWSSTDPNGLFLVLRETGPNTGIFETDFSLVTNRPSSSNMLRVSSGDNITAEYGGGSSTLTIEEKIAGKSGFNFIIYDKPLPPATVGKYYRYSFCDPSPSSKLLCGGLI
ncbi:MAG: hypothetical protein ACREAE_07690, partial [Nitrosopumilaceae archaeon]